MHLRRHRHLAAVLAVGLGAALGCHEVHFEPEVLEGEIDIYDNLYAVSVPDPERAVAVGYKAAIYQTEDGGETWLKRSAPTESLLYDVSMADLRRGWIVGQRGTILRTEDGGVTWEDQSDHFPTTESKQESGFHLFSLHAIDANTAWAVGEWGTRIYTEDGGVSWQDHSMEITMTHPRYVWLSPPEQERVRQGEQVFEDVGLNDIYCRPQPSRRCWYVGEFGYIYWSDDRGRTWSPAEIRGTRKFEPIRYELESTDLGEEDAERLTEFVEAIIDKDHLNIEIEAYASPREVRELATPDDPFPLFDLLDARAVEVRSAVEQTGISWDRLRMRGSPPWDYESFLEDDPGFLDRYIEGQTAEEPRVTVTIDQNPYLFRVRFSDDDNGIIVGLGGVVLLSDDGGRTWNYGDSGTRQALYALAARDGNAMAVGEKGLVRLSENGGRTWGPPAGDRFPQLFTFMRDLTFSPEHGLGLIVGQRGLVLRSIDGGGSWNKMLPPPEVEGRAAAG